MMTIEITHEAENGRYIAHRDGEQVGILEYHVDGDTVVFTHTGVPKEHEGQGIAAKMVQQAMDDVRADGTRKVVPACRYVDVWLRRNRDYADLRK